MLPIARVAAACGLSPDEVELYGPWKAKVRLEALAARERESDGVLVLVTGMHPTPAGEGKTTVSIGLAMALNRRGRRAVVALREPSLGPCLGRKGGATGGGRSRLLPSEDINLHFTGDLHAVTSAHNLLCAAVDNHLHHGNALDLDVRGDLLPRVLDMNDRALRDVIVGVGGRANGVTRETGFQITAASEVMAILCLASGYADLKRRLGRLVVGYDRRGRPVRADDLEMAGAMAVLLRDALKPNLVQTSEGTPALVHGGPFANIAHGCNSLLATRLALKLGEVVVTEAGFGADLGAQKFFDIVCRQGRLNPRASVLVVSVRAVKYHGGVPAADLGRPDPAALERGFVNVIGHLENLRAYGVPVVVALNRFQGDRPEELERLTDLCRQAGVTAAVVDVYGGGSEGGLDLADAVLEAAAEGASWRPLYPLPLPPSEQVRVIAERVYGAAGLDLSPKAVAALDRARAAGADEMPVCVAKTQFSFSADPALRGRPRGFRFPVRDARLLAGAGFTVVYAGDVLTMPGLPANPAAAGFDLKDDGSVAGVF
ncbi:MAG: formate--tetrahydrofolate ligase [Clostridia bacterium]|nr:formate--tetrahydrofolate ligase [Clostridia bacterium]